MMVISVHAISMIYELRALRSRLTKMVAHPDVFRTPQDQAALEWAVVITDNLITKIERTGEYIGSLEREVAAAAPQEVDLGEE